ncbi:DUF600 family protein [Clostridium perfringens]|uniref:hypothetical protein n=1 Tax=Clostridium perfringens TaxID=1502 RepID=UPI0039E8342D|nr:DUF600 family protein [Clostridium perfringens]
MKKVFEDEFMDLQSEFVSLCLELVGNNVDNIYIYISIEEKSKMFNAFFRKGEELKSLNQLNIDNSLIMQFLKLGTEDIEKIKNICNKYNAPIPSEMKMSYDVSNGKYNVDYKYESICSEKTGISAGEIFMKWFMENK